MHPPYIEYTNGIYAIDALYVRPQVAAIYLIVEQGRAAFFDSGTNASMPQVLQTLAALGVPLAMVDFVILSHVHLDHAGGAGAMMAAFPNAKLIVQARGVRHMADPTMLMAAVKMVYGDANAAALYGELVAVPPERIVQARDGMTVELGGRKLSVLETPGHAKHHICLRDDQTGHLFTGDTFGLSYRALDVDGRASVFPTTTPVQFDPPALHASIERILESGPEALYPTHFGQIKDVARLGLDLHRLIDAHCAVARNVGQTGSAETRHVRLVDGLRELLLAEKTRHGWRVSDDELFAIFNDDLELNAQGLGVWLDGAD